MPSDTRQKIVRWMRNVLVEKNWTAERWARGAGTSPTNITRFLSNESAALPSTATLAKLAEAAGSEPRLLDQRLVVGMIETPVLSDGALLQFLPLHCKTPAAIKFLLAEQEMTIALPKQGTGMAFAVNITTDWLKGDGVNRGDKVVVEPFQDPQDGAVVLARRNESLGTLRLRGEQYCEKPGEVEAPVQDEDLEIIGTVIQHVRAL